MKKNKIYLKFKDKNGKKIYEGNTIKYKGVKFEVVLCSGRTKFIEKASMLSMEIGDFYIEKLLELTGKDKLCICNQNIDEIEKTYK